MKKIVTLIMAPFFLLITSCEDERGPNGLTIQVRSATLIPAEGKGCVDSEGNAPDIPASRFSLNSMELQWSDTTKDLEIAFVKIEISSGALGTDYSTVFGGDDVGNNFIYFQGDNRPDTPSGLPTGIVPKAPAEGTPQRLQAKAACSLKFGGVNIIDEDRSFTAQGTVTVQGVAFDSDGVETSIRTEERFTVSYDR